MNVIRIDFIADSSAIICLCRGDSQVESIVRNKRFAITFVTMAEIDYGTLKATNKAAWQQVVKSVVDQFIFHVSPRTPAIYAKIRFDLEKRGLKIPTNDIWIAAIAIEYGLPLLARDEHFSRITGLPLIKC